jgi:hypothetical protein
VIGGFGAERLQHGRGDAHFVQTLLYEHCALGGKHTLWGKTVVPFSGHFSTISVPRSFSEAVSPWALGFEATSSCAGSPTDVT